MLDGVREVSFTFVSRSQPADFPYRWIEAGSAAATESVAEAGLIVTATSSPEPILYAEDLADGVVLLAVAAHTVDTRELAADVLAGAQVIVEDTAAAQREAGDVALAVAEGALAWDDVIELADVISGDATLDPARRVVFKTVGMPWEDLAVAQALVRHTA